MTRIPNLFRLWLSSKRNLKNFKLYIILFHGCSSLQYECIICYCSRIYYNITDCGQVRLDTRGECVVEAPLCTWFFFFNYKNNLLLLIKRLNSLWSSIFFSMFSIKYYTHVFDIFSYSLFRPCMSIYMA